ncbi:hypothetical protein LCGC14_0738510 [marine sediment metagenome]
MKHLFYLHSHITYYVSMAVIKSKEIPEEDIVFIISRNYNNKGLKRKITLDVSLIHDEMNHYLIDRFYKLYAFIPKIDGLIEEKTNGEKYTVYLPLIENKLMQIIATNKKCISLNIIEEGATAYAPYFMHFRFKNKFEGLLKNTLNLFLSLIRNRFYYVKVYDLRRFKKSSPPIFYSITSDSFKGLPYHIEILPPVREELEAYSQPNMKVLVLEGAVEQGNLKIDTLLKGIQHILDENSFKDLYVKYHPVQTTENRTKIIELITSNGVTQITIADEIPFEQITINNNNIMVFGFTSSLLYYAKKFGCTVISYEDVLLEDDLFKKFRSENNFNLKDLLLSSR